MQTLGLQMQSLIAQKIKEKYQSFWIENYRRSKSEVVRGTTVNI